MPAHPAPACDARASLVVLLRCRSSVASVDPHSGWRAVLFDEPQVFEANRLCPDGLFLRTLLLTASRRTAHSAV